MTTIAESGAFLDTFTLESTGHGPLDGLTFGVKDIIDVGGYVTGCGNPTWRDTHPPAVSNAVCVDQMLSAGAACRGKTVTDQLAFSLDGENYFYGTPLNPRAPDRVPGGSSSGSASAVACGLVDFALGTDTGGSVRIPAHNCGIFGLRPSHGRVSVAGVMPFSPGYDTVGVLASDAGVLDRCARVLLGCEEPKPARLSRIYVLADTFAATDDEVRVALDGPMTMVRHLFGDRLYEIPVEDLTQNAGGESLPSWLHAFRVVQWAEIWSCLGPWIEAQQPPLGPRTEKNFDLVRSLDRSLVQEAVAHRERLYRSFNAFLEPADVICMPTGPSLAPLKGTLPVDRTEGGYYPRTLSLLSIAGVGRLPQVSLPLGSAHGVPVGLSLLARHGEDGFLLDVAGEVITAVGG
ncbi:MAG: amidase family protein [Chloroflexota bacterium]